MTRSRLPVDFRVKRALEAELVVAFCHTHVNLRHQAPSGCRDPCYYDQPDIGLLRLLVLYCSTSLLAPGLDSQYTQIAPVLPYPASPPPTPPKEKRSTSSFKLHRHHEPLDRQQ